MTSEITNSPCPRSGAVAKHRNGYSVAKDDRFVAPPPPLEPKPEPAPEVPVDGQA